MIAVLVIIFAVCFVAAIVGALASVNWKKEYAESLAEVDAEIVIRRAEMLTFEAQRIVDLENEVKRIRGAK